MLSFHNDTAIKAKYLARVRHHREMDNIIQGTGWEDGKGCAVGCTLENYDHSRYPIELGLPEWIGRLQDAIFEGFSKKEKQKWSMWPENFIEAIPVGVDVEMVKHKLAVRRLTRLIELQNKNDTKEDYVVKVLDALELVKRCHEAEIGKTSCDWSAAESAAWSAAWSAESVAKSAAWSAWSAAESAAKSAAESAWSAAESAESAAWSAKSAAWSVAWSAAWSAAIDQEAADLLELLRECK